MALTAQNVVDLILRAAPPLRKGATCDTFKCGDPQATVRAIAVAWMATREVLAGAAAFGANLVITHEPTFFQDGPTDHLRGDLVFDTKRAFITEKELIIWRCHDSIHAMRPDGILVGVAGQIGWLDFRRQDNAELFDLPAGFTLGKLAATLKAKLAINAVRVVGDLDLPTRRVAMSCGCNSWDHQRSLLNEPGVDALICGEVREWEASEYARDSAATTWPRGLIVLGHGNSEEAGMRSLADWLRTRVGSLRVEFLAAGDPFVTI